MGVCCSILQSLYLTRRESPGTRFSDSHRDNPLRVGMFHDHFPTSKNVWFQIFLVRFFVATSWYGEAPFQRCNHSPRYR